MKTLITICLLIMNIQQTHAQTAQTTWPAVNTDYLKISRTQKTAARILLTGGWVLSTAGISTALQDVYLFSIDESAPNYKKGMVMFYTGGAAILGSIPLFIAGSKNKRKAMQVSGGLKMEPVQFNAMGHSSYPAFSLNIRFK